MIVPTYNRLNYLKNCLRGLEEQSYKNFEVIVVDDSSSDGTRAFVQSTRTKLVSLKKNSGPSTARNAGAKIARGKILAFIDDDCEPHKNWLLEIAKTFKLSEALSSQNEESPDFLFGQTIYVRESYEGRFPERVVQNPHALWPMGNNLAFKKNVFEKLGAFDSTFDKYHNEDSELAIRAVSKNYRFKRLPSALVYHQKSLWTFASLLKSGRNASVWPILKKKYPHHFKIFHPPIRGIFVNPEDYFFMMIFLVLFPALLIRFILNGQKNFLLFFTKWPMVLFLRRIYIWKESVKNGIILI